MFAVFSLSHDVMVLLSCVIVRMQMLVHAHFCSPSHTFLSRSLVRVRGAVNTPCHVLAGV